MDDNNNCPNCNCGVCISTHYCSGCNTTLCIWCWREHNEDAADHTKHVAVMRDRGMSDKEILADFAWHETTHEPMPEYQMEMK